MNQDAALNTMESCVNDKRRWMVVDKLKLIHEEILFMVIELSNNFLKLMLII